MIDVNVCTKCYFVFSKEEECPNCPKENDEILRLKQALIDSYERQLTIPSICMPAMPIIDLSPCSVNAIPQKKRKGFKNIFSCLIFLWKLNKQLKKQGTKTTIKLNLPIK